jgi:hypothetical protein
MSYKARFAVCSEIRTKHTQVVVITMLNFSISSLMVSKVTGKLKKINVSPICNRKESSFC